jgi:LCP family protein required for cell wall assembly
MIRHFLKIFFASLVLIAVILSVTALGYIIIIDKDMVIGSIKGTEASGKEAEVAFYESSTFDYESEIGRAARNSKRFNVLLVGLENSRSDTIMVASYDTENKTADLISIPRDTYCPKNADDSPDLKKINAVYGQEGIEGLTSAVQNLVGIPLEKYIIIDYEALVACVDLLGGVEVNVPFHMEYSDPYDDPPLYIDIPEGTQILNGEQALKYVRFRKGYSNQDLGRIEAQQEFLKSALKKALGLKLPSLIKEAYSYVETNVTVTDLMSLSGDVIGFSADKISMETLPGMETPLEGLSFYIPDENGIASMVKDMYTLKNNTDTDNTLEGTTGELSKEAETN